jgi:hypothetical protein
MLEAATWLPEPPGEAERLVAACFAALCGGGVFCGLFQSATQQARFVLAAAGTVVLLVLQVFSLRTCFENQFSDLASRRDISPIMVM